MNEPQAVGDAFEATRTILAPMTMFGIPEVLLDEARGLWSIRQPGAPKPTIYRCEDVAACEIVEIEPERAEAPDGLKGVGEIVMNPMAVSRGNALRRGNRILGVVVQVTVHRPDAAPVEVNIKLWLRQLKRGTRACRNVMESARELKGVFDEMIAGQGNG